MDEKSVVTLDEAIKRLPDRKTVSIFRQSGMLIVSEDYDRDELIESMGCAPEIQESGETAQSLGHGLSFQDKDGWIFIETRNG